MLITEKIDLTEDWKKRVGEDYLIVFGTIQFLFMTLARTAAGTYYFYSRDFESGEPLLPNDAQILAIYELTWINK